jgi:N-methylhydantoinase A
MAVLGIDVGGTFTDFVLLEPGRLSIFKTPSTPDDPSRAILAGVRETGWYPDDIVHGSTVATNAVLERRGARTALITAKGFRDVLEIGRQTRPRLYALEPRPGPPLVPASLRFEVDERLDHHGDTLVALSESDVEQVLDRIEQRRAESVAVCLLFSFLAPKHERGVRAALRRRGIPCSVSFEVVPEYREYERTSTTVLNAYVAPVVERYLGRLSKGLGRLNRQTPPRLRIMQSNGGSAGAKEASLRPVRTILSGPAGGVAGAFAVARKEGIERVITLDMGGTSTDVSLCDGSIPFTTESTIDRMPMRIPTVDVHTVGAGGGSIARIDAGGALRVGPESAGADPGPACYGQGTQPTVTDAHLVLGRIMPGRFLGGGVALSAAAAKRALSSLAADFGGGVVAAAGAVLDVANVNMERALRVISVERGHDPRRFVLVAFGGAGPLHACELAQSLSIGHVLVPRYPGVLSALGMAASPLVHDEVRALFMGVPASSDASFVRRLDLAFASLDKRARRVVERQGGRRIRIRRGLDLRYAGQSFELTVPLEAARSRKPARLRGAFHALHAERYGHADPSGRVEVVAIRSRAEAPGPAIRLAAPLQRSAAALAAPAERTEVRLDRTMAADVYERDDLRAGDRLRGPALITQLDATTFVPPAWQGEVDGAGNLRLRCES